MKRWKALGRRALLLFASTVVALLAAEVLVRLFTDTQPPLFFADAEIGRRYRPGFQGDVYVSEAGREIRLRFNREGFRGPDRRRDKPEGVRRVALIGDSMTLAIAVEEEDTLAAQLEQRLARSHPQTQWQVMNFGASAASTAQELAVYRAVAADYDPDLVVCAFFMGNDVTDNSPALSGKRRIYFDLDQEGRLYQLPFSAREARISQWLNRHSELYVWQKTALRRARRKVEAIAEYERSRDRVFVKQEDADWSHAWELTGALLHAFASEVRADGASFALLFIPSAPQVYPEAWAEVEAAEDDTVEREEPERRVRAFCERADIPFVSLTLPFRQREAAQPPDSADWLFFRRSGHMTAAGNHMAAEILHASLFPQEALEGER